MSSQSESGAMGAGERGAEGARAGDTALDIRETIRSLRVGGAIGLFFLVIYMIVDLRERSGGDAALAAYHGIILALVCLFLGLTWVRAIQPHWRALALGMCIGLIALFVVISTASGEPESRFVAIVLTVLSTAAFLPWGPRWQAAMNAAGIVVFAAATTLAPMAEPNLLSRWLGLLAAVALAQAISVFIDHYRRELSDHLARLREAAHFRERQIALMAHDIRNPVSALHGFVNLLEDGGLSETERMGLLARIGSTAASMESLVANVLDLHMLDEGALDARPCDIDPNPIVKRVAEDYAREARRRGIMLHVELAALPRGRMDPRHLERIIANLLRLAIARTRGGVVRLRTALDDGRMSVEVDDDGPALGSEALAKLLGRPDSQAGSAALGPYIAAALVRKSGGQIAARTAAAKGLSVAVSLPLHAEPHL